MYPEKIFLIYHPELHYHKYLQYLKGILNSLPTKETRELYQNSNLTEDPKYVSEIMLQYHKFLQYLQGILNSLPMKVKALYPEMLEAIEKDSVMHKKYLQYLEGIHNSLPTKVVFMSMHAVKRDGLPDTKDKQGASGSAQQSSSRGAEAGQSAQQWLGGSAPSDPMALLAGGMAQLQAVMLKQMVNSNEKDKTSPTGPETVKPGTLTLPPLPQVNPQTSSVDIMDWLEVITTPMQDLSDGSAEWWSKVRTAATEAYNQWASASPVEKLVIQPPKEEELESGRWGRVNSRGASMVLLALHESVRQEMVQRRSTGSTCALIFRLMTIYQPGGQQERVHILQSLQSPEAAATPQKAVTSLRAWARWLRRCQELNVTAPDPSLLARGLSTITKQVLEKDMEVNFRTSLVRSTLLVDTKPSYDSVEKYHHHLLAECETMAVASSTLTSTTTPQPTATGAPRPEPKIKPMRTDSKDNIPVPPPPPRTPSGDRSSGEDTERAAKASVPCKFYGLTYKGCARGTKCPFKHSWEGNEKEKQNRCWTCGGKGHLTKDCHTKKPSTQTPGTPKSAPQKPPTSPTPATSQSTSTSKTVRIDDVPQVEAVPPRTSAESSASEGVPQVDLKEVLADVGKMLKSMSAVNIRKASVLELGFQEKMNQVEAALRTSVVDKSTTMNGLLDSGASHAMREATEEEYQKGHPVSVTLAGEDVRLLRQNLQGTVLIKSEDGQQVQPIVPLGPVIEDLGCSLRWKKGSLQLYHPKRGMMKVNLVNNCPELQVKDALALIQELEAKHIKLLNDQVETLSARLEVMKKEVQRPWDELLKEYAATGNQATLFKVIHTCPVTKDLPEDVKAMLIEGFDVNSGERYLKDLPLTRRKRRALMVHKQWVVNLNSGEDKGGADPFEMIAKGGKILLNIDLKNSKLWDVSKREGVYRMLLWAASQGKISDVISAPQHSTWPTSRKNHRDPGLYDFRTQKEPYGRPDLPPLQQLRVNKETADCVKPMLIWMLSMIKGPGDVGFAMCFPADEMVIRSGDSPRASFWESELWRSFRSITSMKKTSFNMGAYGHRSQNPLSIATNYQDLINLNGVYDYDQSCVPPSLLSQEEMNTWSNGFKALVGQAILSDYHEVANLYSEKDNGVKIGKLTKEQEDQWRNHLLNDHQPYRADCSVCINAQATGYQHRRRSNPSMYTLALDLAGPFKQSGRDMDHEDYKYILVAAYRCPRNYLSAKALGEVERELYVPDDPEEGADDVMEEEPELLPGGEDEPSSEGEERKLCGPETLEDAVHELEKPEEPITIYITRPLRRRTATHVLNATKEIYLQCKQCGLHISQIHSDRAREFRAKAFKEWAVDMGVRCTKTAGGDPAGNSTAELGIKWAKSRVRALIKSAGAHPREWPMAIAQASAALWVKAFPDSPWAARPATTFGNEAWFRSKTYQGKAEKKHDAAGTRWKRGWYRGPTVDVKRGHLIMREDGGLTVAKSVKFNVIDPDRDLPSLLPPAIAEDLPDELLAAPEPPTRQELRAEIEFRARKLTDEKQFALKDVIQLYDLLETLGDSDRRMSKKTRMTSWYTGAFVHGGVAGVRANLKDFPNTSKYLVKVAKHYAGEVKFSAVGISRNAQLGLHRDVHNYAKAKNYVMPLSGFEGGELWVQDDTVSDEESTTKISPNGKEIKGKILKAPEGEVMSFSPRLWHQVQPWEGTRTVMLMYTPRATRLTEAHVEQLEEAGFNVDKESLIKGDSGSSDEEEDQELVQVKTFSKDSELPQPAVFEEMETSQMFGYHDEPQVNMKKMIRKAEVQYTPNVEEILRECERQGKQLDVTHTVSLGDVKKNLDKWRSSALKEFHNLTEVKRAFTVVKKSELPRGCRIVPCKGVYTAKPDKSPQGYRRKTRFVACGNHISEMSSEVDLYAAGLDATSLRTMLAFNANRKWRIGTTDIRQAFVLAKWKGQPVALEPPGIAYELGIAQPGDMWFVEQAIYGLRESPALWSQHRDNELKAARWNAIVDGEEVTLKLEQMITDNQIWKIVKENSDTEPLGYLLVYIDDLLIQAPENIMQTFFSWVAAKWECDDLDVLSPVHAIRFLGMELHSVPGGVEVSQEGFISELLRAYRHDGSRSKSQGSRETLLLSVEEEEALIKGELDSQPGQEELVKLAQKKVGEMLWLSGRTRPDIQYATAVMASRATRSPEIVIRIGERLLDYLCETHHYRLKFVETAQPELRVYTDSSFAPSAGRSHGCAAVFFGESPITWRSSRQALMTMSTAESELIESIDGATLGISCRGLLEELTARTIPLYLHVDNMAACSLLTTSSGSWRTRHLKLRSNWLKEKVSSTEVRVRHEPGDTQRADLGTKPFTRERLKQLVAMWSIVDRRVTTESHQRRAQVDPTWLQRLLLLCQVCGTVAEKPGIESEIPWNVYLVVLVLAIAVIGLWEGFKGCLRTRDARLKALKAKATRASKKQLTKAELKELQRLLYVDPGDLDQQQKLRLVELRERFSNTMPEGTSPIPHFPEPVYPDTVLGEPASSSTTRASNKQPKPPTRAIEPTTRDQGVQANTEPAFQRVLPTPPVQREVIAGPFYQVPGRDHLHVFRECWGLRNAGSIQQVTLCRCCVENGGRRIY
ncbi:RE1 [Symbiodinium sp. CCMP2592]|nr:RE1 [Symbiodinium sp. CCMP2592]